MTILWSGLALGAVYVLVAIGYNIVFVSSNTFNFAQAQLMMVGTFVAYTGLVTLKLPVLVVAVMATVTVMLLASVEEIVAIRPVARSPETSWSPRLALPRCSMVQLN